MKLLTTSTSPIDAKTKFMFVVSDGRPQDRGYSREGVEKEYNDALTGRARKDSFDPRDLLVERDKTGNVTLTVRTQLARGVDKCTRLLRERGVTPDT